MTTTTVTREDLIDAAGRRLDAAKAASVASRNLELAACALTKARTAAETARAESMRAIELHRQIEQQLIAQDNATRLAVAS